jgi:AcrR family transcriptional regulator
MNQQMKAPAADLGTRDLIVQAADRLFYRRGYEKTSFTDIADEVKISRGNFYYHFKSKDDILSAVIELRARGTQAMLDAWTAKGATPRERLRCFADMLVRNREDIQRFGCPVGTLCSELAKLEHPSQAGAGMIFSQFRGWLRTQFEALGCVEEADALSMHLLARSQGIAALAHAFRDEEFIRREVQQIDAWLQALASGLTNTGFQENQ